MKKVLAETALKTNPSIAPSGTTVVPAVKTAVFTASQYGKGEFSIAPDDTVEGYVWSEYWSNIYAATINDGTTTVGAVHWIDLYGEAATSGKHYNNIEIALNNGITTASNSAEVDRYSEFFDSNTGNVKPGTYTIKVYAEGYEPLTAEVEIPVEEMKSVSVGGVTYYYADVKDDPDDLVYKATVKSRKGSTDYFYKKSDLTQLGETDFYYIVIKGTPLSGTLYGYTGGTLTTYKDVYGDLGISTDGSYDAVSSATKYTSHHAGDIPSTVVFGTDSEGDKAIIGLNINRQTAEVQADVYVAASILNAEGKDLTDEQSAALGMPLKANPMVKPSENKISAKAEC